MNNIDQNITLCSTNINVSDHSNGPGEIAKALIHYASGNDWHFDCKGQITTFQNFDFAATKGSTGAFSRHRWRERIRFIRENRGKNLTHIIFPSLVAFLDTLIFRCLFRSYRLKVIGYDSFYQMNLFNLKKKIRPITKAKLFLRLVLHYMRELRLALFADEIFFVADGCIRSFTGRFAFAENKVRELPLKPFAQLGLHAAPEQDKQFKGNPGSVRVVVLGRFLTEWLIADFLNEDVLSQLQSHLRSIYLAVKDMILKCPELGL